jgi:hypothetical protein
VPDRPFLETMVADLTAAQGKFFRYRVGNACHALLLFRLGRPAEEIPLPEVGTLNPGPRSSSPSEMASGYFTRALLLARSKQPKKASAALAEGRKVLALEGPESPAASRARREAWQGRMFAELLEREAAEAVRGKRGPPKGM